MPELSPRKILETGMAFWPARILHAALDFDLFSELAKRPGDLADLRFRLRLHPRSAHDFLDALVALGFLQRGDDGIYRNAPEADLFLDKAKPSYVGGIVEMAAHRLYPAWGQLGEALRTGLPQGEARDNPDFFAELYSNPARLKEFLSAMTGVSRGANLCIARQFPWDDCKTYVDVGTAQGDLAVQIALGNPHLQGAGFDLPAAEDVFTEYVAAHSLGERLRFIPGNFFEEPIPKADVVLMGHILHDWNMEEKLMLIRKAYDALPDGGALVVYESLIDDDRRENAFGLMMSLNMLVETPGGFDYTGADCCGWMKDAGFRETRVEHLTGPDWMVVGIR